MRNSTQPGLSAAILAAVWPRRLSTMLAVVVVAAWSMPAFALQFQSLTVVGYGVRQVWFDAGGGLTYRPLDRRGKPGKPQHIVLAPAQSAAIHAALALLDPTALPAPPPKPTLADMRKLSELFDLTLVYAEQTYRYHGDARPLATPTPAETQALAVMRAVAAAQNWLDTPPVRTAKGAFEVGVQDGKIGVGVDTWNLYQPLADDPRVQALRPLAGHKVRMEVAWERDRPNVFVLKRLLGPLPRAK